MRRRLGLALLLSLLASPAVAQVTTHGMTITPGPLVWSNAAVLSAAQARYAASPSTYAIFSPLPGVSYKIWQEAFQYQMTGVCAAADGATGFSSMNCGDAVLWLAGEENCGGGCINNAMYPHPGGVAADPDTFAWDDASDPPRQEGEICLFAYSWLRPLLTEAQRQVALERLVRMVGGPATDDWGSPADVGNNFMWGYSRNAMLFGMLLAAQEDDSSFTPFATNCSWLGEEDSTDIDTCSKTTTELRELFLDEGFDVRWTANQVPYLNGDAQGGILPESQNYGHYLFYYVWPMYLANDYGRDIEADTLYYKEAVWALIYATSNVQMNGVQAGYSLSGGRTPPYYQIATYGNTQEVFGAPSAGNIEEGGFMTFMALKHAGTSLGAHARWWLTNKVPQNLGWARVLDNDQGAAGTSPADLPLAYCGSGFRYCHIRDSWGTSNPTYLFLEAEGVRSGGGNHPDSSTGSWQLARGAEWVSKEAAAAYARGMAGLGGTAVNTGQRIFHNSFSLGDSTDAGFSLICLPAPSGSCSRPPVTQALQLYEGSAGIADDFFYAAVNYTNHLTDTVSAAANLVASWREFIWIPQYGALCTLDRVQKTSSSVITNTFIHFPETPSQATNVFTGVNGTQEMVAYVLADDLANSTVTYTIRDESAAVLDCGGSGPWAHCDPQHPVDVRVTGAAQSYVPVCVQAYTTGDAVMTAVVAEDGDSIDLTLTKSGADTVVISLAKGATAGGGTVTIGSHVENLYTATVMEATADEDGVSWGAAQDPGPSPSGSGRLAFRLRHRF